MICATYGRTYPSKRAGAFREGISLAVWSDSSSLQAKSAPITTEIWYGKFESSFPVKAVRTTNALQIELFSIFGLLTSICSRRIWSAPPSRSVPVFKRTLATMPMLIVIYRRERRAVPHTFLHWPRQGLRPASICRQ